MKLLLALALSASPSPSPDARAQQVWREYCSLLKGCGLVAPAGACTDAQAGGVSGVRYDEQRCGEPRILSARGVSLGGPLGFRIYRFL